MMDRAKPADSTPNLRQQSMNDDLHQKVEGAPTSTRRTLSIMLAASAMFTALIPFWVLFAAYERDPTTPTEGRARADK